MTPRALHQGNFARKLPDRGCRQCATAAASSKDCPSLSTVQQHTTRVASLCMQVAQRGSLAACCCSVLQPVIVHIALRHHLPSLNSPVYAGYLERQAGNALMQLLAARSAPGSRIIMTAPPTPAEKERGHEAAIAEAAAAGAAAAAGTAPSVYSAAGSGDIADSGSTAAVAEHAAAAAAEKEGPVSNGLAGWQEASGAERTRKITLHHSTFERPTATLAR